MATPGKLIIIEGTNGSGKDAIAQLLSNHYISEKIPHLMLKEPASDYYSLFCRKLQDKNTPINSVVMLALAQRLEVIQRQVKPALERGEYVIMNRSHMSTRAIQGRTDGALWFIEHITHAIPEIIPTADLTIFLEVDRQTVIDRRYQNDPQKHGLNPNDISRIDELIRAYWQEYIHAKKAGLPIYKVDATQPLTVVKNEVIQLIRSL